MSKIQNFLPHGDNYYFRIGQKGLDFGHLRVKNSKFSSTTVMSINLKKGLDLWHSRESKLKIFFNHGEEYLLRIGQKGHDFRNLKSVKNFIQPW